LLGIDICEFGELLMTSGIILNEDIHWLTFHSGYDFAYLLKICTCTNLPSEEAQFFEMLSIYFPNIYDVNKQISIYINLYHHISTNQIYQIY
jgi:CCR4-NOT transcription complex subunit 7/8